MEADEIRDIIIAIIILTAVVSFSSVLSSNYSFIPLALLFSFLIIGINISFKKLIAYSLDADVEHKIWHMERYGYRPAWHLKKPIPAGIIFPLFFSVITLGYFKLMSILTYETRALKHRAAKRYGYYSFTEMTDWHNGLIGAAGVLGVLLLSLFCYLADFEALAKLSAFYAFFSMIPFSNLDGNQIFFGSRVLWATLAIVTLIFTAYALFLT